MDEGTSLELHCFFHCDLRGKNNFVSARTLFSANKASTISWAGVHALKVYQRTSIFHYISPQSPVPLDCKNSFKSYLRFQGLHVLSLSKYNPQAKITWCCSLLFCFQCKLEFLLFFWDSSNPAIIWCLTTSIQYDSKLEDETKPKQEIFTDAWAHDIFWNDRSTFIVGEKT